MNIVKFWSDLTSQWNTEDKCGFCWAFEAPLKESQSNIVQSEDGGQCCTHVFITDLSKRKSIRTSPTTGLVNQVYWDYSFNAHIVRQGKLGTNNYTEIKGHPIEASRWETIYNPLQECLDDANLQEAFCNYLGIKVDELAWEETLSDNYLDNNYFGWKIRATFRIEK